MRSFPAISPIICVSPAQNPALPQTPIRVSHPNGHSYLPDPARPTSIDPDQITLNDTTYALTFADEFDQFSPWQGHGGNGVWTTSYSPHLDDTRYLTSNGEGQYYVDPDMTDLPNPFAIQDGILSITAQDLTTDQQLQTDGQAYSAGFISTELSFSFSQGYVEISAQVPDQQGFLSAFWLLPADGDWSAEIDVFETLGHLPDRMNTNVWNNGSPNQQSFDVTDLSDGFHTYGLYWDENEITWLIDGEIIRTTENTVGEDMYLLLSLAVDTEWTGPVDDSTDFTDGLLVDYIRVYEPAANPHSNGPIVCGYTPVDYGDTPFNETLYGSRWGDAFEGGDGDDVLYGRGGDDFLQGENGNDSIFGQDGEDFLTGGKGDDQLIGGAGQDVLHGGDGTDHMWGGNFGADGARDVFIYTAGDGADYIHDFEAGTDVVDFSYLPLDWDTLSTMINDEGWATRIDMSDITGWAQDVLYLVGLDPASLSSDDFWF